MQLHADCWESDEDYSRVEAGHEYADGGYREDYPLELQWYAFSTISCELELEGDLEEMILNQRMRISLRIGLVVAKTINRIRKITMSGARCAVLQ